jgi:hypothetical protein
VDDADELGERTVDVADTRDEPRRSVFEPHDEPAARRGLLERRCRVRIDRDAVVCERESAERLADREGAAQLRSTDANAAIEVEHPAELARIAQDLAPVLVVDGVHEALDEREPPRCGLRVPHVVDRLDGLHGATLPYAVRWF